jgi:hypothetical protein
MAICDKNMSVWHDLRSVLQLRIGMEKKLFSTCSERKEKKMKKKQRIIIKIGLIARRTLEIGKLNTALRGLGG